MTDPCKHHCAYCGAEIARAYEERIAALEARVTELQTANTREVEARRAAVAGLHGIFLSLDDRDAATAESALREVDRLLYGAAPCE